MIRNPEIAKNPSTPTEKRSCSVAAGGSRLVIGQQCHSITSAASSSRHAFSALRRGSNTCPRVIGLRLSYAPRTMDAPRTGAAYYRHRPSRG